METKPLMKPLTEIPDFQSETLEYKTRSTKQFIVTFGGRGEVNIEVGIVIYYVS